MPIRELVKEFRRLREWSKLFEKEDNVAYILVTRENATVPSIFGSLPAFNKSTVRATFLLILFLKGQLLPTYARRQGPREEPEETFSLLGGVTANQADMNITTEDVPMASSVYSAEDESDHFERGPDDNPDDGDENAGA